MTITHSIILGAFVLGLVATLLLAAWLTPSRWWQRPTLRGLAIVGAGTWGIGTLLLALAEAPAMAANTGLAETSSIAGIATLKPVHIAPGRKYRVHQDLNLRMATGTGAPRIAVVPAGAIVTATGVRDGDWWQVSAAVDGKPVQGWSSSLWLRRVVEGKSEGD